MQGASVIASFRQMQLLFSHPVPILYNGKCDWSNLCIPRCVNLKLVVSLLMVHCYSCRPTKIWSKVILKGLIIQIVTEHIYSCSSGAKNCGYDLDRIEETELNFEALK